MNHYYQFENYLSKISLKSPRASELNQNIIKSHFFMASFLINKSFCNFTQGMADILSCPVQNIRVIHSLMLMLWANKFLKYFSLRFPDKLSTLLWVPRLFFTKVFAVMYKISYYIELNYNRPTIVCIALLERNPLAYWDGIALAQNRLNHTQTPCTGWWRNTLRKDKIR